MVIPLIPEQKKFYVYGYNVCVALADLVPVEVRRGS